VTAGHWPGQGPTEEHLTQIADNLSHAHYLVERSGHASQPTTDSPADLQHAPGQVMHTLYVAAHGTVVALGAYAADLQGRLETAERRRDVANLLCIPAVGRVRRLAVRLSRQVAMVGVVAKAAMTSRPRHQVSGHGEGSSQCHAQQPGSPGPSLRVTCDRESVPEGRIGIPCPGDGTAAGERVKETVHGSEG
jgi:hypothetical protein